MSGYKNSITDINGNVGINQSNPASKLHITNDSGGSGGYLKITDAVYNGDVRFGMADGVNNNAYLGTWSNNEMLFFTNSTERMRITSAGAIHLSQGTGNAYVGTDAGNLGTSTGTSNTAFGVSALRSNTTGLNNVANGVSALYLNTTGANNSAFGTAALYSNTTGAQNTANGVSALQNNTTGNYNTAVGLNSLYYNTTGSNNTANGGDALQNNTTGSDNVANGREALYSNTTGSQNTANGHYALYYNTTGIRNTANGRSALLNNTTGSGNIAIGSMNSAGTYAPAFDITTENNRISMGSTSVTNADIQVAWTVLSDARDKTNFGEVPHGLDFVSKLKPISYKFKESRDSDIAVGDVRYGFKAQDILALEGKNSVIINAEDEDRLRYNETNLIPILVKAIQELKGLVQSQQAEIELLKNK